MPTAVDARTPDARTRTLCTICGTQNEKRTGISSSASRLGITIEITNAAVVTTSDTDTRGISRTVSATASRTAAKRADHTEGGRAGAVAAGAAAGVAVGPAGSAVWTVRDPATGKPQKVLLNLGLLLSAMGSSIQGQIERALDKALA